MCLHIERNLLASVTIEDSEQRASVSDVGVGDVRVLHGSAPPLHAGSNVADLKRAG